MLRRTLLALAALAILGLAAGAAHAGVLTSATWTTEAPTLGMVPLSFVMPVGASGTSTSSSIDVELSALFSFSTLLTDAPFDRFVQVKLGFAAGPQMSHVVATPGMASETGMGALSAYARVRPTKHTAGSNVVPHSTLVRLPIGAGIVGSVSRYFVFPVPGGSYLHYLYFEAYGWTPGTRTFTGQTSMALARPDVVAMGYFELSAHGGGTVQLVAPSKIRIVGAPLAQTQVSLTTLRLHFVPEPGTLLLLAAGAVGFWLRAERAEA